MMGFNRYLMAVVFALALLAVGCSSAPEELVLATTTSTESSGLLDELIPAFEARYGYEVKVVAVGTGQALEMGRRGDADVLLVHAPAAEEEFVAEGHGLGRHEVMHNDFVLAGPPHDPASVSSAASAVQALTRIYEAGAAFVSRGDDSGTHKKERALWAQAGLEPAGGWYLSAGQGMAATLRLASEKGAYVLTDRATFLALRDDLALEVLFEGDPALFNQYSVIIINPEKHPGANVRGAEAFLEFMLSPEGREIIADFGVEEFGQPLFVPDGS